MFIIFHMPVEAPFDCGSEFELLCAAWIHIAGKDKYTCNSFGSLISKDQCCARAIAPADQTSPLDLQCIHHCQYVGSHQLIRKWSRVPRTATVTTAIDDNCTIAIANQRRNLIT